MATGRLWERETAESSFHDGGHRSGLRAQITDGLKIGTQVVTHPGNALSDGSRVSAR